MPMPMYETKLARIKDVEQCVGKTIVAAISDCFGGEIGMRFDDGTYFYCQVGGSDGYMDRTSRPDADSALELGLIDEAERARYRAEVRAMEERIDRARYEEMKARYEREAGLPPA